LPLLKLQEQSYLFALVYESARFSRSETEDAKKRRSTLRLMPICFSTHTTLPLPAVHWMLQNSDQAHIGFNSLSLSHQRFGEGSMADPHRVCHTGIDCGFQLFVCNCTDLDSPLVAKVRRSGLIQGRRSTDLIY
jgi:hypothetical protein